MTSADSINHIKHHSQPYEALASIYDKLMEHVDYINWAKFITVLLEQTGKRHAEVLELACGTGIIANLLAKQGFKVTGCDRSPAMIEEARRKSENPNLGFLTASFENFPLDKAYDAALCLYDSINYIMELDGVAEFIARVGKALKPSGIFIFDICTRHNSFTNFRGYLDMGCINGWHYQRKSDYSPKTHLHINDFILHHESQPEIKYTEHHEQHIYSLRQIQSAIMQGGMILEQMFDDILLRPPRKFSSRIHFLCRKQ